ncbi:MAG: DinB family protein [Cytophagales bacterium]
MLLARATFDILNQLHILLDQLEADEYALPLPLLSNNSVGKHIRHVVEFYLCLLNGLKTGLVDYDARKRDLELESNLTYVKGTIDRVASQIVNITEDDEIKLRICPNTDGEFIDVKSTYFRELGYNIEHVIHHMALIKIAVKINFDDILLPENFGVAYSTIKYQHEICAP